MKKIFAIILVASSIFSCHKEDDTKDKNGIIISKSPIWGTSVTDDDSLSNTYFLVKPVIYQQGVTIQTRKNKGNVIKMLDVTNGQFKWEWNDWLEKNVYAGNIYPYFRDNKLTWLSDYENYQINLDNGQTIWKNSSKENYGHWSSGLGNVFVSTHLYNRGATPERGGGHIVVMSDIDGKVIEKFKPKYGVEKLTFEQNGWYYEGYGVPFTKNNDTYIFIKLNDPSPTVPYTCLEFISLYNLTKKEWVYERKKLKTNDNSFGTPHPTVIYDNKVYHGGFDVVICHDLMTGEKIWETSLPQKGNWFSSAGILIDNGKIYANSDNGQLFCLNASNGSIIWQIRSSGSSTPLSILNGVVYFVGGGDGKLHAVDAETGSYIWKIESPDIGKNKWAVFSGMCAVVPGGGGAKGKIVVTTGLNAYCYEAIK